MAFRVEVRLVAEPYRSMRLPSRYSFELYVQWKTREKITDSMQVKNAGMPKLMSLYVTFADGSNSLPFRRPKMS